MVTFRFPNATAAEAYEQVIAARDGGVWVLGADRLRKWKDGQVMAELEAGPNIPRPITVMMETRAGGLLIGTLRNGLYMLAPGVPPFHFDRRNGLLHDWVRSICEDHEGNIWLGTGGGLDELRRRKVQMLRPPDDWQGCAVLSFSVRPDGSVWVGTEGAGLYHYDGGRWTSFSDPAQLPNLSVWSVLETKQKELLIGSWGGGLLARNGERFEPQGELANLKEPVPAL